MESFRGEFPGTIPIAPAIKPRLVEPTGTSPDVADLTAALARLGGDPNLLREIIQLFFEDSPELLQRVRICAESGKVREAERAAHSLRGLTSNFDAKRAAAAAGEMEMLANAGRLLEVLASLPKLEAELELLRCELKQYLLQLA